MTAVHLDESDYIIISRTKGSAVSSANSGLCLPFIEGHLVDTPFHCLLWAMPGFGTLGHSVTSVPCQLSARTTDGSRNNI